MENSLLTSYMQQSQTAFASNDLKTAKDYFEKILIADRFHFEALNNLGVIAFQQGDYDQAVACFENALQGNSTCLKAIENLSQCFYLQGQYIKTVALLQRALSSGSFSAKLIEIMACCFILLHDMDAAQAMASQLQRLDGAREASARLEDWILLHRQKKQGDYAKRSWCREHAALIRYLESIPRLNMTRGRFWEYPFVFEKVMQNPHSHIIDIGTGNGVFDRILSQQGHRVVGVDNDPACLNRLQVGAAGSGIEWVQADARNLEMFPDNRFDTALLVSVIEHIPSNTIWCEKRQILKTAPMLRQEIPDKVAAIKEALRIVKVGGRVIITSDIYLDYPPGMNICWQELLGLGGIDREDIAGLDDLYISDNPIHKGRGLSVAVTIEKSDAAARR